MTTLTFHQQKWFLARHLDCQESIFRHPITMFPCRIRQPCCLTLCLLFYIAQSIALVLPVCNENLIRGEFYIPNHSPCVRHKTMSVINCSAGIYYPSDNFLKILVIICELYETFTETTTHFFGAKTNVIKKNKIIKNALFLHPL